MMYVLHRRSEALTLDPTFFTLQSIPNPKRARTHTRDEERKLARGCLKGEREREREEQTSVLSCQPCI